MRNTKSAKRISFYLEMDGQTVTVYGTSIVEVEERLSKDALFCNGSQKKYTNLRKSKN